MPVQLPDYLEALKVITEIFKKASSTLERIIHQGVIAYDEIARRRERARLLDMYMSLVRIDTILNPSVVRGIENFIEGKAEKLLDDEGNLLSVDIQHLLNNVSMALNRATYAFLSERSGIVLDKSYADILRVLDARTLYISDFMSEINNNKKKIRRKELLNPILKEYRMLCVQLSELRPRISSLIAELDKK